MKYTKEALEDAVKNSVSTSGVIRYLGLIVNGSRWRHIKSRIDFYNIDISHFKISYDHFEFRVVDINDYLSNKKPISTYSLKLKLLKESIIEYKCDICHIDKWLDKKISLQLHHIDGNSKNHNLSNLQLLCPNCHTQTDNYGSKNNKSIKVKNKCVICNKEISKKSTRCQKCYHSTKIIRKSSKRPIKEELEKDIIEFKGNKCSIGRKYGVSDNAVRKWCIIYNIPYKKNKL